MRQRDAGDDDTGRVTLTTSSLPHHLTMVALPFRPKLLDTLETYSRRELMADLVAGSAMTRQSRTMHPRNESCGTPLREFLNEKGSSHSFYLE